MRGCSVAGHGTALGEQPQRAARPVDVRAGGIHVQGGRQHVVVEGGDHFDQPGGPGRGLGVADIGFDRAQPQRVSGIPVGAVGGQQGAGLDRIAQGGAGAVRLHDIDLIQPDPGVGDGLADHALLGGPVRGGQPVRGAVLVDRRSRDHRQHPVVVAAGLTEAFQHEYRGAFTPAGAIRGRSEGFAAPVDSQPALAGELDKPRRCGHHRDPTGQGQAGFAVAQRLTRQMRGHQRRTSRPCPR